MTIQYLVLILLMAAAPAWAFDLKGIEFGRVATEAGGGYSPDLGPGQCHRSQSAGE